MALIAASTNLNQVLAALFLSMLTVFTSLNLLELLGSSEKAGPSCYLQAFSLSTCSSRFINLSNFLSGSSFTAFSLPFSLSRLFSFLSPTALIELFSSLFSSAYEKCSSTLAPSFSFSSLFFLASGK